jgi:hypothetical protein
MTICENCSHSSSYHSGDKILSIVGEQSFTLVLSKSYAISLGIHNGDFLQVSLDVDRRIIIERVDKSGFRNE